MTDIPVLDLRHGTDPAAKAAFLGQLRDAAHRVGFFYLVGTGVDATDIAALFALARRFFALPEADRIAISNVNSPHFRGYTRVGRERTNGQVDWRDQLDIGAERPALTLGLEDPAYLRLDGPNQWPAALPELRPTLLAWQDRLAGVAAQLLGLLAEALGLAAGHFDSAFADRPHLHLKVIRYPGRPDSGGGGDTQGVGAHKDYGFLTLLLQDDHGGLQVALPDGRFVDATPRPDAFVVNLGEMLEVVTDGYLTATVHRVVSPPAGVERISLPFFYNPRLDAVVEPVTLPPELAAQARGAADDPANPLLTDYGANALKGWLRAHPEVAERHHPDLLAAARPSA